MGKPGHRSRRHGDLIGRREELALLTAGVNDAIAGRGRIFVVSGEAGIGKTMLADEVSARAREAGAAVAWGRCWQGEDAPPFWPWVRLLRLLDAGPDVPEVLDRLERPGEEGGFVLFDAVMRTLADLSERQPLVVVLEDLHAADAASLRLLDALAREIRASRIVLLCTYREEDVPPGSLASRVLATSGREGEQIRLSGLGAADVARLFGRLTGNAPPPALAQQIFRATEGNPLLVQEMAQQLRATGDIHRPDRSMGFRVPRGAEELIRSRLRPLDPEVLKLLETASVIGPEFDAAVLQKVSGLDRAELLALLDAAAASGAIHEASALGRYGFSHVLDRETLYQGVATAERVRLHAAVGQALEELYGLALDDHVGELAHHFFKAGRSGDLDRALDYAVRAALRAAGRDDPDEAERQRHRAFTIAEAAGLGSERKRALAQRLDIVSPIAPAPETRPEPEDAFLREGEYWTVIFGGVTARLKDSKGLHYLAHLLRHPGEEFHAMYLASVAHPEGVASLAAAPEPGSRVARGHGDAGEVLDAPARRAYRRRLTELREELDEAEAWNDPERASRVRDEIDFLTRELAAAVGLGGRARRAASGAERARLTVTKAIRRALERLAKQNPALGRHLEATIRTGTFVSYMPDPRTPPAWRL
jgi:hypothetical protein